MKLTEQFKKLSGNKNLIHEGFKIGILLKGIDSLLEIIGGILLIFINPDRLSRLTVFLTQHELSEDPKDIIANFVINLSSKFTVNTQNFGIFYLVSHGIVKIIIVVLLWRRKIQAYPVSIAILIFFIAYQIYRYTINHSIGLMILTVFDVLIIILTYKEYKNIKNNLFS